jgi:glycosyltransferase involved in cell wall biosynthesis
MRCLWLTLADPEPAVNGGFIYSSGLIRSLAGAGWQVTVLALSRPDGAHRDGERDALGITWRLAPHEPRSKWAALVSPLPQALSRTRTPALAQMADELVATGGWDAIVFDGNATGWILEAVRRHHREGPRPALVYASHNHETSLARLIARRQERPSRKALAILDALKVAQHESSLIRTVDLITSNCDDDTAKYRAGWADKRVEFVRPGYDWPRTPARTITAATPRRAIVIGNFDWVVKRIDLEAFVDTADPIFAAAGVELQIVGIVDPGLLGRLRPHVRATHFTGRVPDLDEPMNGARMALVIDRYGGFKLKTLDYIFARLPLLGIEGAMPGLPVTAGQGLLDFPSHQALAEGAVAAIDDLPLLNRLQQTAWDQSVGVINWNATGARLAALLAGIGTEPAATGMAAAAEAV